jgi:Cu-Zn family superoxide dismutase
MKPPYLIIAVIIVAFFVGYIYMPQRKPLQAIAVFNEPRIKGTVRFIELPNTRDVVIELDIQGLTPNHLHGFHVHEAGDLTDHCKSMCAHFNPHGKTHGCPGAPQRHVGDLGNIKTDKNGVARYRFSDNVISLHGTHSIIGRGLIIHEDTDDCGLGGDEESLKTGNAGKRIACAVIGYAKECYSH